MRSSGRRSTVNPMELRCRRPLLLTSLIAGVAFSLLAAGCGGGGSPRVASVASSTTAANKPQSLTSYSACMRSHGVPSFPDPDSGGVIQKGPVVAARSVNPSRFDAASTACGRLFPAGPGGAPPTIPRADRVDYLKAAACMRRHGIPNFPDPTFQNNGVKFNIPSSINPNSPQVVHALPICRKLIPAGLPYSGTN
jgi:hypothetical protein